MSKLSRVVGKIFGSNAGPDQIGVFGSLFAGSAATTINPATAQSLSNWLVGWNGAAINGNAPAIEDMNAAFFVHSYQIAYMLQQGIPEWNTDTIYYENQFCSLNGSIYKSLTDDNTGNNPSSDSENWGLISFARTGDGKDYWGSDLESGWVWADGKTIGSADSGATNRANADTFNLYKLLWDNYSNSVLVIQDSSGAPTIRGASAAADFAANKRLPIIDKRGRVSAGKDDMGGTAANRLTNTTMAPDGVTLGATGGEQTHVLTETELASHTHTQPPHAHGMVYPTTGNGLGLTTGSGVFTGGPAGTSYSTQTTSITNSNTGGDAGHNNVQPTILCNYVIKL